VLPIYPICQERFKYPFSNHPELCSILSIPFTTCALRFVQHGAEAVGEMRTDHGKHPTNSSGQTTPKKP
jgi:hypothetical protein